jgi:hypothetical protein
LTATLPLNTFFFLSNFTTATTPAGSSMSTSSDLRKKLTTFIKSREALKIQLDRKKLNKEHYEALSKMIFGHEQWYYQNKSTLDHFERMNPPLAPLSMQATPFRPTPTSPTSMSAPQGYFPVSFDYRQVVDIRPFWASNPDNCVVLVRYRHAPNDETVFVGKKTKDMNEERMLWRLRGHSYIIPCQGALVVPPSLSLPAGRYMIFRRVEYSLDDWKEAVGTFTQIFTIIVHLCFVGGVLSKQTIKDIMVHLVLGLQEMHERNVLHLDLKPYNVVMDHGIPKLIDFGTSAVVGEDFVLRAVSQGYTAPELDKFSRASAAADVFSLGRILLFLCIPQPIEPFVIPVEEVPFSKDLLDFQRIVAAMTHPQASRRPTLDTLLKQFQRL